MSRLSADMSKPTTLRRISKAAVYRACRDWHGYLSAFAFLALIFFSATGLILNHPEWTESLGAKTIEQEIVLSPAALDAASASEDPSSAITRLLRKQAQPLGNFSSGEVYDGEAFLRFEGPRGSTDAVIELATGHAALTHRTASVATVLNNLHRGKNAGAVWQSIIDISAVVILALSLIGYALFFTLRFKLRTGLMLTAISAAVIAGAFAFFVP